ncbi:porimin [Camelus dromedarius]|uniref:porimin n=1 Tax=Camelus dromedarius TaxID=9838 RepID=UPI00057BAA4F|nr:porimin [Camelus dromedarius]
MGVGSRGFLAALALGVVLVIALLKMVADSTDLDGSQGTKKSLLTEDSNATRTGSTPQVPLSHTNESSTLPMKPSSTTPVSSKNVTTTTLKPTAKSSVPVSSKNKTTTTLKPTTSKTTPPAISTNKTSTTARSTPKITSASHNTSRMSTSTVTTAHNSSVTSVSSPVTITATINSKENKGSRFDTGSFVGGIVLTLGVLSFLYIGCKVYYSRRGIRYRTIDEHDAII